MRVSHPSSSPAPALDALPAPALDALPAPALDALPAPALDALPAPALDALPAPALDALPAPAPRSDPNWRNRLGRLRVPPPAPGDPRPSMSDFAVRVYDHLFPATGTISPAPAPGSGTPSD